ncbi:glycosyltransferase [Streptomyces sp. NPDC048385]|uniref:glycosyltransferase n=1 Tax=unclassified Streptomyces TaxID=2593676 RepID=UPI0034258D33
MHRVLIALPTLGRRPLDPLLTALVRQAREVRSTGYAAEVLLLDNSADGHGAVRNCAARHGVRCRRVPRRGFAQVRNAALDAAADHDALVFIDDDEIPEAGWLRALLEGARTHRADVVWGPVRAVVPSDAPRWLAGGRALRPEWTQPDGPLIGVAASNNTLVRMATVRETALSFEEAFDRSGGEDTVFFSRLAASGARMVWIGAAVVSETQDADRLTLRGLIARWCRQGAASAAAERTLRGRWGPRLTARRLARVPRGAARIVRSGAVRDPAWAAAGLEDLAFACGWAIAAVRILLSTEPATGSPGHRAGDGVRQVGDAHDTR